MQPSVDLSWRPLLQADMHDYTLWLSKTARDLGMAGEAPVLPLWQRLCVGRDCGCS